jgi:K+-transporting ATPase ATPase A chain
MPTLIYIALCLTIVAVGTKPLGNYIASIFTDRQTFMEKPLGWLERLIYRICGIYTNQEMDWAEYAKSIILFSFFCFLLLFFMLLFQSYLPLNPQNFSNLPADLSFNIAIGFVTNGDWQSYEGETTLSNFSQTVLLAVQNFVSTAASMGVFVALARGIVRKQTKYIGNFYKDLVRGTLYILLPISIIFAIFLASQGVVQNLDGNIKYIPLEEYDKLCVVSSDAENTEIPHELKPTINHFIPQGAVASQIAIRTTGSGGSGFFAVNAAHPYESPTPIANFIQTLIILLFPTAITYSFGCMIGDKRQGLALIATMYIIFLPMLAMAVINEEEANPLFDEKVIDNSAGNMEGKEVRFGSGVSAFRIIAATATSNGSGNAMLDSFSSLGILTPIILTQFSEVVIGGAGTGIYNIFIYVILTVFIGGLMVGRTPEYMGKKIDVFDVKMASVVIIVPAMVVLIGTAIAVSTQAGRDGIFNSGAQGFSEILYAFSSAGNNDGGTFAGLNTNSKFYNIALAIAMFTSRFFVIIAVLAIAGSFASKNIAPENTGTLKTHTPIFVFLLIWMLITVGVLAYIPSLALGPIAEHFHLHNLTNNKITIAK